MTIIAPVSQAHAASGTSQIRSIFAFPQAHPLRQAHLALVGTFPPRRCGIATFTSDLAEHLGAHHPSLAVEVYPLAGHGEDRADPTTIISHDRESYIGAARRINESGVDAVWLQHEYGIFGGSDGEMVCDFVDRLAPPLILTCHTVLPEPSPRQLQILRHLVSRASQIMVMSEHSRQLLGDIYGANDNVLTVIEHGAPDRPFCDPEAMKAQLGLAGRKVLMTFGLLGPGKGLETAIAALPAIVDRHPDILYRIVGATHPDLVASEGEAYRERLMALAAELGVSAHVAWDDRFLETDELLDQLHACDIYLTPYPGMQQSTSGTLSYAVAMGKAVISTPYLHARELLANGVGRLVEAGSSEAIAAEVNALLDDPAALVALQRRAYARGRETIWPRFADACADLVERASAARPAEPCYTAVPGLAGPIAMSDGTGMFQHSIGIVPDRNHGYCLDDNARALMLMNVAEGIDPAERQRWSMIYASFIQHAWNNDAGAFRNFMNFDRTWCEDTGSEDSNGRALWALGHTIEHARDADLREWALALYDRVLPSLATLPSPRAIAFVMLGVCARLRASPDHKPSIEALEAGGALLASLIKSSRRPNWIWFEVMLAYDNPRLPQALLEAGALAGRQDWVAEALETLRWICAMQTNAAGQFRPIGSETFGKEGEALPFDQQPLEAQAAIEACAFAFGLTHDPAFRDHAKAAFGWFFGRNDRAAVLADWRTGRCRDGVTPRGANRNTGAESILAFQLASVSIRSRFKLGYADERDHA